MNRIFTLILVFTFQFLSATPQISDYLIYNGKTIPIFSNPLESYLVLNGIKDIDRGCNSSSCWRGYIATWELENGKLYLVKIERCGIIQSAGVYTGLGCDQNKSSEILDFFIKTFKSQKTYADWFTGILIAPQGRIIEYTHMGYKSVYEQEQHFIIENGILNETETITNIIKPELYKQYNLALVQDTIFNAISKLNWKYLEEEFLCEDYYLIAINKKGKVSKVKYQPLLDSKWENFWYSFNSVCRRRIKKSIKDLRFKKYLKGKPIKMEIKFDLFSMYERQN
ncbi:MAG: hypothetical protein IIC74_02510 [Bacteroidetes bacterium]|nr:hypothetical protein [Bacteroidota bacterium]